MAGGGEGGDGGGGGGSLYECPILVSQSLALSAL